MEEKRLSIKLETKETFRKTTSDYLRKRGIKKLGDREVFTIEETEKGIQLCGGTAMKYYFDDKKPEDLPSQRACVLLPKEFFPQLKDFISSLEKLKK